MPKQLNVNLAFTADTSKAKAQLQDLQNQLAKLTTSVNLGGNNSFQITKELKEASNTAILLRNNLQQAVDVNTGKLDLTKFKQEMDSSNMSIEKYRDALMSLGPEGQKSFVALANSITQAEIPTRRVNALLTEMGTTIKNAARWQISSSVIHGFMGAISTAYGYAQDLDRSLTNIGIVTGKNTEEMARFAVEANKSAQALSSTTTAYTDAALIYYQQGLSDSEVKARTDVTMKLANVTGQSAEEVSSYMTAIWNNFATGSETMESFADKITALGATTASSSEEMARGLNQFASLGSSMGLAYDDAAAALATVIAQTRQSAATVGNSFRTLLQRFEGLKLGDTLEDGVDLTKYSEALDKVGVKVLDANNDLRDMSDIIRDLGARWDDLTRAQQMAVAQTVGGVRNSNTLIAWMDNFEQFEENLQTVANSEGVLQEQQERYEKSWQASQRKVKAAWQAIYDDLIDEDFFKGVNDALVTALNLADNFIKGIGGLPGLLTTIGAIATTVFKDQIASGLENAVFNLQMMTKAGQEKYRQEKVDTNKALVEQFTDTGDTNKDVIGQAYKAQGELSLAYLDAAEKMTEKEREIAQIKLDQQQTMVKNIELQAEENQQLQDKLDLEQRRLSKEIGSSEGANGEKVKQMINDIEAAATASGRAEKAIQQMEKALKSGSGKQDTIFTDVIASIDALVEDGTVIQAFSKDFITGKENVEGFRRALFQIKESAEAQDFKGLEEAIKNLVNSFDLFDNQQDALNEFFRQNTNLTAEQKTRITELANEYRNLGNSEQDLAAKEQILKEFTAITTQEFQHQEQQLQTLEQHIVSFASYLSSLGMLYNQIQGLVNVFKDDSLSGWDKFFRILSAVGMMVPTLVRTITGLSTAIGFMTTVTELDTVATAKQLGLETVQTGVSSKLAAAILTKTKVTEGSTTATFLNTVATGGLTAGMKLLTGAIWEAVAGFAALLIELAPFIAIAAVVAIAVKKIYDALHKEEQALDAANKKLEESTEKAEETKRAYEETTAALEEYKNVQEEIDNMEPGSKRAEAINEENEKLLELIDNHDLWQKIQDNGGLQYDANGLIQLTDTQQKVIENDLQREMSLARQAKYQDKINQLTAENNLNYKNNYSGEKMWANKPTGTQSVTDAKGNKHDLNMYEYSDITRDVASALNKAGLSAGASDEELAAAINQSGQQYLIDNFNTAILPVLHEIAANEQKMADFTSLQNEVKTEDASIQAYKMQNAQASIGADVGDLTGLKEAQQLTLEAYANLSAEQQAAILDAMDAGASLTEAWTDAANIIAESTQLVKDGFVQGITEANSGNDKTEVEKWVNSLSDQEIELLGKIKIEKGDTLQEIQHEMQEELNKHPIELDTNGLTKKQAEALQEEFEQLTDYIVENADAIEGLDDHLADCTREASIVARAILRFDDAIQDVTDHYEDWSEALTTGSIQEAAKAANEMKEAYGNLLDIDGSQLSSDFLQNTENLELMKKAIEDDGEAYDELLAKMGQDILATVGLDTSQYEADKAWIMADIQAFTGQDWGKIEVGADLNNQDFLDKLSDMVTKAGMTAEQATAYLASMGIDAEVIEVPEKVEPVTTTRQYWVPPTYKVTQLEGVGGSQTPETYGQLELATAGHFEPVEETSTEEQAPKAWSLKVTSAHKSSGGNFKYSQASHGGGGQSPGSGSKGSGSKGGGGGGSQKEQKKDVKKPKKHVENEDRYHDLEEQLKDLNTQYDRLDKTKNRVFGKSKLKYLDQEIKKTEQQIKLNDDYIKSIKNYLKVDKERLDSAGVGASYAYDENTGEYMLTNYEQTLANITAQYNSAIDEFNASQEAWNASAQEDADKEILDAAQERLDTAKDLYDQNLKYLKQYEDTYNKLQDKIEESIDLRWKQYDLNVETVTLKVQIDLEFSEEDRKVLQWMFKYLDDASEDAADKIANLNKQVETFSNDIDSAKEGIQGILGQHGINVDFNNMNGEQMAEQLKQYMAANDLESELTQEEADALYHYMEVLRDSADGTREAFKAAHEAIRDMADDWADRIGREMRLFDRYTDKINHFKDIVNVTGRDFLKLSSSDIDAMNDAIVKNANNALEAQRQVTEELTREVEILQQRYDEAVASGNELLIKECEKDLQHYQDLLYDAEDEFQQRTIDALDAIERRFSDAMDNMVKDWNDAFGNLGLNWIAEEFERQSELNELYLPDYKKYHSLNNTIKEINKSISETTNDVISARLKDLLDDVNGSMREGAQISQVTADIYEKRVALLLAEQQLWDARNAKSNVMMTRDNEGNFSYTYTADTDSIEDAESAYADAVYEYQDYIVQAAYNYQAQLIQIDQEYIEEKRRISEEFRDDEEKLNEALAQLEDDYLYKRQFITDELENIYLEQQRFRDEDWAHTEQIVGLKLLSDDDLIVSFEDTTLSIVSGYKTMTDYNKAWEKAYEQSLKDGKKATKDWRESNKETLELAGKDVENFQSTLDKELTEVQKKSDDTKETINNLVTDPEKGMEKTFDDAIKILDDFDERWAEFADNIVDIIGNTCDEINTMLELLEEAIDKQHELAQAALETVAAVQQAQAALNSLDYGVDAPSSGGTSTPSSGGTTTTQPPKVQYRLQDERGEYYPGVYSSWEEAQEAQKKTMRITTIVRADTGMYTGEWGKEGKLAVLHEKELVLNKQDTANFLSAVKLVRGIADNMQSKLFQMGNIGQLGSNLSGSFGISDLNQNVNIYADFPNVQSHNEIELALQNLVNSASQYVNRK